MKEKLEETLVKLADEDPTFRWHEDEGTGQTIVRGMGELHLDILVDRLRREFGVAVRTGRPQVVYRETVGGAGSARETFERAAESGEAIHGDVTLSVAPRDRGAGNAPYWLDDEVRRAVEEGIEQALPSGVVDGYPVLDVEVTVDKLEYKETVSKPLGFTIAASTAFRAAMRAASPVTLSPVGDVEVSSPPEFTGEVIASINQRRGRLDNMEERSPQLTVIQASCPIEQMFGYTTELRSLTQGRASFTMTFSHYDRM